MNLNIGTERLHPIVAASDEDFQAWLDAPLMPVPFSVFLRFSNLQSQIAAQDPEFFIDYGR